jgi:hypothetical protein
MYLCLCVFCRNYERFLQCFAQAYAPVIVRFNFFVDRAADCGRHHFRRRELYRTRSFQGKCISLGHRDFVETLTFLQMRDSVVNNIRS